MYQVMIVDDEEPVLESFSLILKRDSSDFNLCGTARSGYEALELVDELKPDVIFMDIQMPGIDGIETIRQIRQHYPRTVFILATAFERFDIARKAIHLGVFSYLVKPVSRKTFLEELEKVRVMLDKRKENRKQSLTLDRGGREERERLEQKYLSRLTWGSLEKEEWEAFSAHGGFHSDRGAFYLVDFNRTELKGEAGGDLFRQLKNRLNYRCLCFSARMGDRYLLLFPEEQDLSQVYSIIMEQLKDMTEQTDLTGITVGCGGVYPYPELSLSYREAMEPFLTDQEASGQVWEREQLMILRGHLRRGEQREFTARYNQYWNHQFSAHPFGTALGKMIEAYTLFMETLGWYSGNTHTELFCPAGEISRITSESEWEEWSSQGLGRILADVREPEEEDLPGPLKRAVSYIRDHYDSQIYLGSVAEACGVSTGYLSRLFSEHLDSTFVDYLNRYRTDQAMILLKKHSLPVKEVAYRTGYQDPNYFSRIFRKYKGLAPSDV